MLDCLNELLERASVAASLAWNTLGSISECRESNGTTAFELYARAAFETPGRVALKTCRTSCSDGQRILAVSLVPSHDFNIRVTSGLRSELCQLAKSHVVEAPSRTNFSAPSRTNSSSPSPIYTRQSQISDDEAPEKEEESDSLPDWGKKEEESDSLPDWGKTRSISYRWNPSSS